jgi:hypothetical protein
VECPDDGRVEVMSGMTGGFCSIGMIEFTESVVRMTGMVNMLYSTGMIGCLAKETRHRDDRSFG